MVFVRHNCLYQSNFCIWLIEKLRYDTTNAPLAFGFIQKSYLIHTATQNVFAAFVISAGQNFCDTLTHKITLV